MPIYEFKCESCAHIDEILMKMSDPAPEKCSVCGAKVHKIMSQSSFSLKGTGWYVTDYKNNGQQNKESESGATKSISENKTSESEKASPENNTSATTKESTAAPAPATSTPAAPSDK